MGILQLGSKHLGLKVLADRSNGYLAIGGTSFWDVMKDDTDSESLVKHLNEKRPCLAEAIASLDAVGKELLDTGHLGQEMDSKTIGANIQRAIQADQEEAALDDSIWASKEWKWQEIV